MLNEGSAENLQHHSFSTAQQLLAASNSFVTKYFGSIVPMIQLNKLVNKNALHDLWLRLLSSCV